MNKFLYILLFTILNNCNCSFIYHNSIRLYNNKKTIPLQLCKKYTINEKQIYKKDVDTSRLIVVGNIYNNINNYLDILVNAKVFNNNLEWIAEPLNTVVVQLGNLIDFNPLNSNINIENYNTLHFNSLLKKKARLKGGEIISLIGNNELLYTYYNKNNDKNKYIYKYLIDNNIVLNINNNCYCNNGISNRHLKILENLNKDITDINKIWRKFLLKEKLNIGEIYILKNIIYDEDGILFNIKEQSDYDFKHVLDEIKCDNIISNKLNNNKYIEIINNVHCIKTI